MKIDCIFIKTNKAICKVRVQSGFWELLMRVRLYACGQCMLEMLNHATFLHTTELESLATLCFRAFDGSNYEVRCSVAKLLGGLVAITQQQPKANQAPGKHNTLTQYFSIL